MTVPLPQSSGDLIADRRFAIAQELHNLGLILAGSPVFVRKLDIERNEKGRCRRCDGAGSCVCFQADSDGAGGGVAAACGVDCV